MIAEQGHYAGREQPTSTRQGIYAAAPGGKLLASINTRDAEDVIEMLERALRVWKALPDEERWLAREKLAAVPQRWTHLYPENGLVLRVHSRDLEREEQPRGWRRYASNRDYAWFRKDELQSFLPASPSVGMRSTVDEKLVKRIAALHLVDNVRGQVSAFEFQEVERAELFSEVSAIHAGAIELVLDGATRSVAKGTWSVNGHRDRNEPSQQERGFETRLLGRATLDAASGRFTHFELVAVGERWGATQYNGRERDQGASQVGVVFVLADADERVAPASIWRYGWR